MRLSGIWHRHWRHHWEFVTNHESSGASRRCTECGRYKTARGRFVDRARGNEAGESPGLGIGF